MKAVFLKTTNTSFTELIGKEVTLTINLFASYTFDTKDVSFDFRHGYARTSLIKSIKYDEISLGCFDIIINTLYSEYTFRHGIKTDKKPLTKDQMTAAMLCMI